MSYSFVSNLLDLIQQKREVLGTEISDIGTLRAVLQRVSEIDSQIKALQYDCEIFNARSRYEHFQGILNRLERLIEHFMSIESLDNPNWRDFIEVLDSINKHFNDIFRHIIGQDREECKKRILKAIEIEDYGLCGIIVQQTRHINDEEKYWTGVIVDPLITKRPQEALQRLREQTIFSQEDVAFLVRRLEEGLGERDSRTRRPIETVRVGEALAPQETQQFLQSTASTPTDWINTLCNDYNTAKAQGDVGSNSSFYRKYRGEEYGIINVDLVRKDPFTPPQLGKRENGSFYGIEKDNQLYIVPALNKTNITEMEVVIEFRTFFSVENSGTINRLIRPAVLNPNTLETISRGELIVGEALAPPREPRPTATPKAQSISDDMDGILGEK